jgi:hypothetical protein
MVSLAIGGLAVRYQRQMARQAEMIEALYDRIGVGVNCVSSQQPNWMPGALYRLCYDWPQCRYLFISDIQLAITYRVDSDCDDSQHTFFDLQGELKALPDLQRIIVIDLHDDPEQELFSRRDIEVLKELPNLKEVVIDQSESETGRARSARWQKEVPHVRFVNWGD